MSEAPKRRHKKKSFLQKMFGGRKRSRTREDSSSSESTEPSNSESSSPRESPSKLSPADKTKVNRGETAVEPPANTNDRGKKPRNSQRKTATIRDIAATFSPKSSDYGDLRLATDTPTTTASASDRNLQSKIDFLSQPMSESGTKSDKNQPSDCPLDRDGHPKQIKSPKSSEAPAEKTHLPPRSSQEFEVVSAKEVMEAISPTRPETKATTKLLKHERQSGSSDSDESDTTESAPSDDDDDSEVDIRELYFTTGKYITYFFLEMERQSYNPQEETYTYIHYRPVENLRKGEQSSSDSASPNISTQARRNLLHRRSADNLFLTSPTSSCQHSSPESIKSVPLRLKPRSTSHDAIARKKDRNSHDGAASMDSLAKQALLAAQVLNLIPAQKARERNFLHGRVAANSLLGPVELEKVLPNREIKIFVGTWNMNGHTPPKELNDFMLPSEIQTIPDMLAIGTQESCSERAEWEASLQETLGPSHVLLTSTGLGTLHLALFLRRDLIWFCSVPEEDSFSTRPGTAFRTKGAVALALILFGTSFLFVTAHLTAHQDKVKERMHDIKRIVRHLDLPKDLPTRRKCKDVTQNFDCVFWCGDLNFRLSQPREEVIQWVSDTSFPQASPINLAKDQLRTILNEGTVLRGFQEAPITFPPTYKYDPGTQTFDSSSKQRTPAYTDRILFKGKGHTRGYIRRISQDSTNSHKDGSIECLVYDSVPSICTSDHKPVWGVFKTTIRPGIDTIPLAAGLFNREIYLEGIKRRVAAMDDSYSTSKVCSLQ